MTRAAAYRRCRLAALAAFVAGGIATTAGALLDPQAFFPAWLAAFWYWLAFPLGALALLLIHNLTGGKWQVVARPPLDAAVATMPLFILAFLPVLAGLHDLYAWTRPQPAPLVNRWYLNLDFFGLRAALYFLTWNFFAFWQLRRSNDAPRSQALSALGLILVGVSATWAAIDWIMSIEPNWFSSIFGMMTGSGSFVTALAFALVVIIVCSRPEGVTDDAFRDHLANLATILLAVDIFWAYTSFSQWLIIWEENLTSEIPWYIERLRPLWRSTVLVIVFLNLAVPLFALVWTPAKRNAALVRNVSFVLLLGGMLQSWWLILPPFRANGLSWIAPVTMLAFGGLWLWLFLWWLERGKWFAAPGSLSVTGAKS
ncbi:MAG TPA: hypothetical protein VKV32_03760 [Stellaceae bacterium]|nr:hypothetical protein [Stellaceae bacterium]